jgi:hypothetical protein
MKPWELFLLKFVQAAAPTLEMLFIHKPKSVAIFNASDDLFNGVVDTMTAQQPAAPIAGTPASQ